MHNYTEIAQDDCEFIEIASEDEIQIGERLHIEIDGLPLVVFNIGGEFYAIADLCSHDDGPLGDGELENMEIVCPRHGARFDLRSGKALTLPAVVDIPAYPVRVKDSKIEIGLPLN